ncbi:hypothetical protein Bca52824_086420 [Brassica carinata]|uniref:Major facilitator superfamily (MFS) profile domain-containing protein n=1 Tax=Brassica carinata TaxID=52824 RepID=A0A8X7PA33_BRACI|nr:hypothetical protein Bca52824_086420 [Brassica carinata]
MAGGAFVSEGGNGGRDYEGGVTVFVVITCMVAAMGGLLFGYDLGISGGVTSMDEFLSKFFPQLERQRVKAKHETAYCKFDDQKLQLFTSSLYLAALVASFVASVVTRKYGRKVSMFTGGLAFLTGALINAFAINVTMLIIGRLLLGVGVGFANQSTPVYLSEMAPAKIRGALNICFQVAITSGILVANLINYGTSNMAKNGWRVSLGLAAVPAILMVIGSFFLPDTPNSMLERGKYEEAKQMLKKVRGTENVDHEFQDIRDACEAAKKVEHPWKNIRQSKYRPALVFCSAIPFFQQITGINVIMFYAPVLFKTLGFGDDAALMSAVITGVVNVLATFVSLYSVDRFGRRDYEGGVTVFVVITCMVAAMGGLLFGYDLGISGGVTSMDEFLSKFFPQLERQRVKAKHETAYCKFDDQKLQLFTSSLYLAALVASFVASVVTRKYGRKVSMFTGGLAFLTGALINAFAINVTMLIIGRLLLGVGVGFANQSTPVYLSEMAPAKIRGALNICFQVAITSGILVANLINYGTSNMAKNGWRVSLGLAAVPAILMVIGSFFLPDTPNSMLERGKYEEAKQMLKKVRGTENVDHEFQDIRDACEAAKKVEHPWKNIRQSKYRPALVFCSAIPFFQQITGINVIMFYAPVLFKTLGFGDDAALMSAVITGVVNVLATFVSLYSVDRFGRRFLFLEGGIQMFICQILVGSFIGLKFGTTGTGTLTPATADWILVFICVYVAGFAWSWGPLGWLVPSEICPLEIRPAGQAINVSVNMFFTFLIGQFFLTMLCHMKFGLFYFFAGMVAIMTIFIYFLFPETRGVPIEEMGRIWKQHWFWKNYIPDDAVIGGHDEN